MSSTWPAFLEGRWPPALRERPLSGLLVIYPTDSDEGCARKGSCARSFVEKVLRGEVRNCLIQPIWGATVAQVILSGPAYVLCIFRIGHQFRAPDGVSLTNSKLSGTGEKLSVWPGAFAKTGSSTTCSFSYARIFGAFDRLEWPPCLSEMRFSVYKTSGTT